MVIDAQSGQVLSATNPDDYRFPASLTKMMTMYLVFEAVRDGRLSLSEPVPVSAWAAAMPPTKLGLVPGTSLTVEQALLWVGDQVGQRCGGRVGRVVGRGRGSVRAIDDAAGACARDVADDVPECVGAAGLGAGDNRA